MAIKEFFNAVIEYETPRYVKVHNPLVGLVLRSSQLIIISYIVGWALVHERGYQESSPVESSFITKVKGTTSSKLKSGDQDLYNRVWDEADYVVPPAENGAFFITTNVLITPNQTQGKCSEDPMVEGAVCDLRDNRCEEGQYLKLGHGSMTGSCVPSPSDGRHLCEISAWCPVENDELLSLDAPVLSNTEKFTVYIKNSVAFPYFGQQYRKNNIGAGGNSTKPSFYHPEKNPLGQIFNIGEIVSLAGGNYTSLAIKGGVIGISITWNCDLDWDFDKYCKPRYSFSVLEDSGWNFRHAYYHEMNRRTLLKAYGIKFIISVDGLARKFSLKNTVLNVGNGLALLGITTVLCEFVLMYFIKEKNSVAQKKYDYVFAPPLLPGLLAAAPMAIATQHSTAPEKTTNAEKNNFGTQTFIIDKEENKVIG